MSDMVEWSGPPSPGQLWRYRKQKNTTWWFGSDIFGPKKRRLEEGDIVMIISFETEFLAKEKCFNYTLELLIDEKVYKESVYSYLWLGCWERVA